MDYWMDGQRRSPIIQQSINPGTRFTVELSELAKMLTALGCPVEKSADMAAQLDKRARQLAAQKGCPHDDALQHLLGLMRRGWSAKEKGL